MSGRPYSSALSERSSLIVARLERLPLSRWQATTRLIVGAATFFDAFDALAIAYAVPAVAPAWHLSPLLIGILISAGFAGQLIGALCGGLLAERFGRKPVIVASVAWFGVLSLACAFATGFWPLAVLRFLQGLGLGAEVPVAATYVSELAKTANRGRFVLLFELVFPIGLVASGFAGAWIVPHLGWQYLFVLGGAPALIALALSRTIPESPRWLASRGRLDDAERTTTLIEEKVRRALRVASLPPAGPAAAPVIEKRPSLQDLFGPVYRRRTYVVWVCWFATYFVNFGLVTWLPSVYQNVFHLPLDQSLRYALATSAFGFAGCCLCAVMIDRIGRRPWFAGSFLLAAAGLLALAAIGPSTAARVLVFATIAYLGVSSLSLGLYLYTAELYPTRIRAIGVGAGTAWLRIASIISPFIVGNLIGNGGLGTIFLIFGLVSLAAATVTYAFALETAGKSLEELSP